MFWQKTGIVFAVSVFLLIGYTATLNARLQSSSEYLLVEHVERLVIYNRYQQHVTPEEQKLFVPFIPLKILDAAATLNDGFTSCMKIELQGRIFYLLNEGIFDGAAKRKLGFLRTVKDAAALNDTVRLLSSDLKFFSPDRKKHHFLSRGKILVRYFREGKEIFAKLAGQRLEFGWIKFSQDKTPKEYAALHPEQDRETNARLSDGIQRRIQFKLTEANKTLQQLFSYFDKQTNTRRVVPQWRFAALEDRYVCLLEPEDYAGQFVESTRYLAGDIDNMLLGTDFSAVGLSGKIEIGLK